MVRICAVGKGVSRYKVGERYLVQTDYRWLPTANSNAAFGYNIEGGLQEYVLMDERIITSPKGESMLIPASEKLAASAVALVEPWACVEDSYAVKERRTLQPGGRMLIVAEAPVNEASLETLFRTYGKPGSIVWTGTEAIPSFLQSQAAMSQGLPEGDFDDVIYFGHRPETIEKLFPKVAARGLLNLVLSGEKIGRKVVSYIGRVHYGGIRIIGTTGGDPCEAMSRIPESCEIRPGDAIHVIGAGGPMGVMHVVRNLCQGVKGITVYAGDLDDKRLAELNQIAEPLAEKHGVRYFGYNPKKESLSVVFHYAALMAPVPALAAQMVETAAEGAILNIFAGIAATVTAEVDLDKYIRNHMYFIGTSGSVLEDMITVLRKVEAGSLDTNLSVAAVSGLDGAVDGIRAVEKQSIGGKILVYPSCRGLGLTTLGELEEKAPAAAKALGRNRLWTRQAEQKLLEQFAVPEK